MNFILVVSAPVIVFLLSACAYADRQADYGVDEVKSASDKRAEILESYYYAEMINGFDETEKKLLVNNVDSKQELELALKYKRGDGVKQSYEQAFYWFKRSAIKGNHRAQFYLGVFYMKGIGTEENHPEAVQWFEKSAQQGHKAAQYNLAFSYLHYKDTNIYSMKEKDFKKPLYWATKAANQGDQHAMLLLKDLYILQGKPKLAIDWLKKSAKLGLPQAQNNLAMFYAVGNIVPKSYEEAIYWYEKEAKQGWVDEYNELAEKFYRGIILKQDYLKAMQWYTMAANEGSVMAKYMLSQMYEKGQGVQRD